MKLLSVAIPCYNSAAYMNHCVETLLAGGEEVEIIIVNDGSTKDNTLEIARDLESKHPSIVKVVDKPNGGHGSAVNSGLAAATGKYFKVVDSDDWVDEKVLVKILDILRSFEAEGKEVDMFMSNFMYDKAGEIHKKIMHYRGIVPADRIITWDDCKHFPTGKYILMHAVIYRTQVLRDAKLQLPEHCFYVDNIFVFTPFPYVKTLYYLNETFYHYFIGRDDQSVNASIMIKRIDQQIKVNTIMADQYKADEQILKDKTRVAQYMFKYLEMICGVTGIMCNLSHDKELYEKKYKLFEHIKEVDPDTYKKLNVRMMCRTLNSKSWFFRFFTRTVYHCARVVYGFN